MIVSDGMGYECNPSFSLVRNFANNNLLMYVLQGILHVEQFGREFSIERKQGILMDLTKPHKYYFDRSSEAHMLWFHFRGTPCKEYMHELSINRKTPMEFTAPWLEDMIYDIFDTAKSNDITKEFSISYRIYKIIIDITKQTVKKMQNKDSEYNSIETEMDNYISANLDKKLKLDDIARHFNMSKYNFCRTFKRQFNVTPFDYIKSKKIGIAKKMLVYTNDSISDIADYLGYYDQSNFTNVFKSLADCSPKKFRMKNIETEYHNC